MNNCQLTQAALLWRYRTIGIRAVRRAYSRPTGNVTRVRMCVKSSSAIARFVWPRGHPAFATIRLERQWLMCLANRRS